MKSKKSCRHDEERIILYFYGEIEDDERADVEARLQVCDSCRSVLAGLQGLQQAVPQEPSIAPDDATLHLVRRAAMQRIRAAERQQQAPRRVRTPWWEPRILVPRLALAVVLVVVGFGVGRIGSSDFDALPYADASDVLQDLLLANAPVETANGSVRPSIVGVQEISFDPEGGTVGISYNTVNEVYVRGRPDDVAIQQLLQQALLDDDNPTARLLAVKVVNAVGAQQEVAPDSQLVATLTYLVKEEQNEGIRLKALEALRVLHAQTPLGAYVKRTLLNVLLNDQNSAVRIAALEALTEGSLAERDLTNYLQAVQEDENSFIRYRAATLLAGLDRAEPLEQLSPAASGNQK